MRIFVAGASGVIGVRLVPMLVEAGHVVAGMTRTPAKAEAVRGLGAEPVVCDVYDAERLAEVVRAFAPDAVIHELTDLPDDLAGLAASGPANSRIRLDGTRNLVDAARAAGASRVLAQSVAFDLPGPGGEAKAALEAAVLAVGGVVLRYGYFHGPGTWYEDGGAPPPRVHVDEAARRTVEALDAPSGILEILDPE